MPAASSSSNELQLAGLLETQGPATSSLDAAVDYLRLRMAQVLPLYVVAMLPYSVVILLLIDAIVGERRSAARSYCLYLAGATVWRWIWLARLQQRVQEDLQGRRGEPLWPRLPAILAIRLLANVAMTWGSFFVLVPTFYGLFAGSFAAPLLLQSTQKGQPEPWLKRLGHALSWIHHSTRRLWRVTVVMTFVAFLLTVAILASGGIMASVVLPSLFGQNTADLSVTIGGWGWQLSVLYFIFLVLDAIWTVASVLLYYESQSRRIATDLMMRLHRLMEAQP